ncbi:hypothetical protein TNCV_3394231 [Trichonephila clavipes]|nr:hypothetical protein TNCV_3394231 [Trichonephila clavipes]
MGWFGTNLKHYKTSVSKSTSTEIVQSGLSPEEIANLLQELPEIESDGGGMPCSNLDSDDDIRLSECYSEGSEESADVNDNILIRYGIYVARDGTEWIMHNSNFPDRFTTRNVL